MEWTGFANESTKFSKTKFEFKIFKCNDSWLIHLMWFSTWQKSTSLRFPSRIWARPNLPPPTGTLPKSPLQLGDRKADTVIKLKDFPNFTRMLRLCSTQVWWLNTAFVGHFAFSSFFCSRVIRKNSEIRLVACKWLTFVKETYLQSWLTPKYLNFIKNYVWFFNDILQVFGY